MQRILFRALYLAHITGARATFLVPSSHSPIIGSKPYWYTLAIAQSMQQQTFFSFFAILLFDLSDYSILRYSQSPCNVILFRRRAFLLYDCDGLVYQRHQQFIVRFGDFYLHILSVLVGTVGVEPTSVVSIIMAHIRKLL